MGLAPFFGRAVGFDNGTGTHVMCIARALALLATAAFSSAAVAAKTPAADAVLVLGALHDLHGREPSFDYAHLGKAIDEFAPDVLVLEVRPDELAERKDTPGRPEYPKVIWPLLERTKGKAIAMEPGGEAFQAIAARVGAAFESLKRRNPDGAAALSRLNGAAQDALLAYWDAPRDTQDAKTAVIAEGVAAAQLALAGREFEAAQGDWDNHMARVAIEAVGANQGRRVLILGSYRNRALLERAVRGAAAQRVISLTE